MLARSLAAGLALCVVAPLAPMAHAAQPRPTKDVAAVEIVEFADFQCPFSARATATIAELQKTYGDKLAFRWMNLPLPFHQRARAAAIAAEAARRQGKLDAMYDKLFANQRKLEDADLRGYAKAIGLDLKKFDKDLVDPAVSAEVDRHIKIAGAVGATGTPTFFVNGKILAGAQPTEKFTALVDAEVAAAGKDGGAAWRETRTASNNEAFAKYVLKGEAVPDAPPAPVVPPGEPGPAAEKEPLQGPAIVIDTASAPLLGDANAKAELVVFADLQCPFSARAVPMLEKLVADKQGGASLRFKHLPLAFHPMAQPAAEAVACAAEQGKAWQLIDLVYGKQQDLNAENLAAWEKSAGLDQKKLTACLASGRGKTAVEADVKAAGAANARGTPTLYVNGLMVTNWTDPKLPELVDSAPARPAH